MHTPSFCPTDVGARLERLEYAIDGSGLPKIVIAGSHRLYYGLSPTPSLGIKHIWNLTSNIEMKERAHFQGGVLWTGGTTFSTDEKYLPTIG